MRKAELEDHYEAYTRQEGEIRDMVAQRQFPAVFGVCKDSFPHMVPAIQYRRRERIEPQTPKFLAFEVICKYAPALFEHEVLDALLEFVRSVRILASADAGYLQMAETAAEREETARLLWNHLEQEPGASQRDIGKVIGHNRTDIEQILDVWDPLGVVARSADGNADCLWLRSHLSNEVDGLCHTCGVRGRGRKESFLKSVRCQRCGAEGFYHIKYTDGN
jgi:hypothetical protein